MADKLHLSIVTPNRKMYDGDIDMAILRGVTGDFGVLPGHAPFATTLAYGIMRIRVGEDEREASIMGGFVEVQDNTVIVLSDAAEWPEEIDIKRAEEAKERAERMLHDTTHTTDVRRAELALRRAMVRIEVSSYTLIKGNRSKE